MDRNLRIGLLLAAGAALVAWATLCAGPPTALEEQIERDKRTGGAR